MSGWRCLRKRRGSESRSGGTLAAPTPGGSLPACSYVVGATWRSPCGADGRSSRVHSRSLSWVPPRAPCSRPAQKPPRIARVPAAADSWIPGPQSGQQLEAGIPRKCWHFYTPSLLQHHPRVGQAELGKNRKDRLINQGRWRFRRTLGLVGAKTKREKDPQDAIAGSLVLMNRSRMEC